MLKDIADAGSGLEGFHVLVDTRRVSGALSATDLWRLADRLVHYRRTFDNKTAILCPLERFDHSRFFALCAENRGFNVQAFISYEDAMEWLMAATRLKEIEMLRLAAFLVCSAALACAQTLDKIRKTGVITLGYIDDAARRSPSPTATASRRATRWSCAARSPTASRRSSSARA
jgi:hypothetical protein